MPTLSPPRQTQTPPPDDAPPWGMSAASGQLFRQSLRSSTCVYGASEVLHGYFTPMLRDIDQLAALLPPTIEEIHRLVDRPPGWNGYDATSPSPRAIDRALLWTSRLFIHTIYSDHPWFPPHVTSGANGEVVLEWWNGDKSLEVYIEEDRVEYLKTASADPDTEILDGDGNAPNARAELWAWLTVP